MRHLKRFESFVNDTNRDVTSTELIPKYNPVVNKKAEEFVDSLLNGNYAILFKVAGMKMPKNLHSSEMDDLFDEVREKSIKYFIEHPESIGKEELVMKQFKVNGGDGIPRMYGNVGGTSHANSLITGQ